MSACPVPVPYSLEDRERAGAELAFLPDGAVVERMLMDYAVLRKQARLCRGEV